MVCGETSSFINGSRTHSNFISMLFLGTTPPCCRMLQNKGGFVPKVEKAQNLTKILMIFNRPKNFAASRQNRALTRGGLCTRGGGLCSGIALIGIIPTLRWFSGIFKNSYVFLFLCFLKNFLGVCKLIYQVTN